MVALPPAAAPALGVSSDTKSSTSNFEMDFIYFIFAAILLPLCYLACCRRKPKDSRGEYRAVAAQYGDIDFGDVICG